MCQDCYVKYGSPTVINEKTMAAVELIAGVYEHSIVGGGLHVLLDDWNLEAVQERYVWQEETPEQVVAENKCLRAFQDMTMDERASALAIFDGYLPATRFVPTAP